MSVTGDGPIWLVREEDVVAHLFFAAAEIGKARLEVGGMSLPGSISFPNAETGSFSFFTTDDTEFAGDPPKPGSVVRLEYARGDDSYSFLTELNEVADTQGRRRWRMTFPRMIERSERRIVLRHVVHGRAGFKIQLEVPGGERKAMVLYDISAAGLSFGFQASRHDIEAGLTLAGSVTIPGCDAIPCLIEIRNVRPLPGESRKKLAGCRFVGLTPTDHQALAESLGRLD